MFMFFLMFASCFMMGYTVEPGVGDIPSMQGSTSLLPQPMPLIENGTDLGTLPYPTV
jgi:hypothetical protein